MYLGVMIQTWRQTHRQVLPVLFFRTKQLFGKEEDVLQSETNVSDLDNFLSTGVAHWKQALVNAFTFLALKGAFSTLE